MIKRHEIVWLTMYIALIGMIMFGLAGDFKGALICSLYIEVILIGNLIDELRRREQREEKE